jgi:seryl-tRNA synthetase
MTTRHLDLPSSLPPDIGVEIAKRACYCDSRISSCEFDAASSQLRVNASNGQLDDALMDKVSRLVEQMKSERLAITPAVLRTHKGSSTTFNADLLAELIEAGDIFEEGRGVVARSGRMLELLQQVDRLLTKIAVDVFAAEIKEYNVLMPADWLRRAGYFSSFGHSLTFAFHLREDFDQLEDFSARHRDGAELQFDSLDEIHPPEFCLSPAICYHAYGAMKDQALQPSDNGLKVFTAAGRCFRYESKNITDFDRLWEFSMREIIFVGEKEKVTESRSRTLDIIWRLVEKLDLTATLETAADPFFATDFRSLRFFQLANELKYELRLPVSDSKSIAVASFNYHETFFGQNFGIEDQSGEKIHTGCAAFGLERLVYAAVVQRGFDDIIAGLAAIEADLTSITEGAN